MRVLIVGAAGLLGQKLTARATTAGHAVVPMDYAAGLQTPAGPVLALDITDPDAVQQAVASHAPDWVANTAAFTAVDDSEGAAQRVHAVNVEGVGHLLGAASDHGARLLTLSTDYVFDGAAGPYRETDPRRPLGVYGKSKAAMEELLEAEGGDFLIVRTMVLYGAAPGVRTNFGLWLVRSLESGTPIRVVTDQVGNTTLADDLARLLVGMMEQEGRGVYHAAGEGLVSRYAFAMRLAAAFDLDAGLITPVTTDELGQRADRPLQSGLLTEALTRDFGLHPAGLDESLEAFRAEYERHGGPH